MNDKTQSRKWLLTFNNPEKFGYTHDNLRAALSMIKNLDYWCLCDEIGKEGTYHTHLFLFRKNPVRFQMLKNRFPTAHIDYCRGSTQENRDYVRKEGKHAGTDKEETNLKNTFEEYGECPIEEQGKRNDLHQLYGMIKDGLSNYDIVESNPGYMLHLDQIEDCRQVVRSEAFRNRFRELSVEYWSGKTGAGKTRSVMEMYDYQAYRITDYQHPFDAYTGQDVIIFDEFRSSLRIQDMLNYLDGYPLQLPCRYNNRTACYTKVYLLSNILLQEQYQDIQREYRETWNAFLRRIHTVKTFGESGVIRQETVHDHLYGFHGVAEEQVPFSQKYRQELLEL